MDFELLKSIGVENEIIEDIDNPDNYLFLSLIDNLYKNNISEAKVSLYRLNNSKKYKYIYNLFVNILDNKSEYYYPFDIKEEDKVILDSFLNEELYMLAADYIEMIGYNTLEENIFVMFLRNLKDNLNYIIGDVYDNNYIKSLERKLYLLLLEGDLIEANKIFDKLERINNTNTFFFQAYRSLVKKIDDISKEDSFISTHSDIFCSGTISGVVYTLLDENDLYRVDKVIKDNIHEKMIALYIYKVFMDVIISLNEKKTQEQLFLIKENINIFGSSIALADSNLVSIPRNIFEKDKIEGIEDDVDYYDEYMKHYFNKEYESALNSLLKHLSILKNKGQEVSFDYKIKELKFNIEHKDKLTDEYLDDLRLCYGKMVDGDAEDALADLNELGRLFYNPTLESYKAICLCMLEREEEAIPIFIECEKYYIDESALVMFMAALDQVKDYSNVIKYGKKYNNEDEIEDTRFYYLLSIAYYNLGFYEEALDCINSLEVITVLENNLPIVLEEEREIINKAIDGNVKPCFTLEEYVDYSLSDDEEQIMMDFEENPDTIDNILKDAIEMDIPLRDKICYLLSVTKVLKSLEEECDPIMDYLEALLKTYKDDKLESKVMTKELKNYRNI